MLDNLAITFWGAHGVAVGTAKNFIVRNCVVDHIGGSVQIYTYGQRDYPTRFGNGIQNWGDCNGFYVNDCILSNTYYSAVTSQVADGRTSCMSEGIYVENNLCEKNSMTFEFWLASRVGNKEDFIFKNCSFAYNIIRDDGHGFGRTRMHYEKPDSIIMRAPVYQNVTIHDNVFIGDTAIAVESPHLGTADNQVRFYDNTVIMKYGINMISGEAAGIINNDPNNFDYITTISTVSDTIILEWRGLSSDGEYIFWK